MDPGTLEIILVRHGETEWNHLRRIQGQIDVPLNPVGLRQADAIAQRLARRSLRALYTSDLRRASQTAAPIAAACGLVAQPDERLRERNFGEFQGSFYDELQRTSPQRHQRILSRDLEFDLEGGETIPMLHRRVCEFFDELSSRHREGLVVVVTHGGVLDCAYRLATGLALDAPRTFGLFNAGLNTIAADEEGRFRLVAWGDVDHLATAADEIDPRARPAAPVDKVG
jgi:2,3-bisphosphoglycerate-dependent phosphoglycerate mutase